MLKLLPYTPDKYNSTFLRLLVEPTEKPEIQGDLLIPSDIGRICEYGIVHSVCEGSVISPGDKVLYKKIDRQSDEHLDTISIDGKKYDVLYENEVWAFNGQPFNRIFVLPTSDVQVNEAGLILPESVSVITQKGTVFRSPAHYSVKAGDEIEYRKQERQIYPTVDIDNIRYDVLHEADIFLVNGKVAPWRIIVKIDIAAQTLKRTTADSGLIRSPLFQHMLYNMQVGVVKEIGELAQNNYPQLRVGDHAILHHRVESEGYRLIGRDFSKHDPSRMIYEYRVLDGFTEGNRDVMGKIVSLQHKTYFPFGAHEFLEWEFDLLEKRKPNDSLLVDMETNLENCHTLTELKPSIEQMQKEGFAKSRAKINGLAEQLSRIIPSHETKDAYDHLETMRNDAIREATKLGNYIQKQHLLHCHYLNSYEGCITPYHLLYPITIYGQKFLIAHKDFIIANTSNSMGKMIIKPLANRVVVKPVEEGLQHTHLLLPESAKEVPQKGIAIAVGPGKEGKPMEATEGCCVLYRKGAGIPLGELEGYEGCLIMEEGKDTIAVLEAEVSNAI